MKLVLLAVLITFVSESAFGQADAKSLEQLSLLGCIEVAPKYPGGLEGMKKLFADSMHYPKEAEKQGLGGKVVVIYMVDTSGNTTNIKIYESAGKDFDEEAIRLVHMLKGWKPATRNDKKIIYYQSQPFLFIPNSDKGLRKVKRKSTANKYVCNMSADGFIEQQIFNSALYL